MAARGSPASEQPPHPKHRETRLQSWNPTAWCTHPPDSPAPLVLSQGAGEMASGPVPDRPRHAPRRAADPLAGIRPFPLAALPPTDTPVNDDRGQKTEPSSVLPTAVTSVVAARL